MTAPPNSLNSFFYLQSLVFKDLGVLIPFTLFESKVLATINIDPSQISPNDWAFIWAFEIICRRLDANLTLGIFLSFYDTKFRLRRGWVTLATMEGKILLKPHFNHYKSWRIGL